VNTPQYEGEVAFVAKWLNEYDTENRLEGDHSLPVVCDEPVIFLGRLLILLRK